MRARWVTVALAVALGLGVLVTNVLGASSSSTTLARARFGDIDINAHTIPADRWHALLKTRGDSDVWVVHNTIPENGGATGWHTHPGPSLILVTSGTVTNYSSDDPTCAGQEYSAGEGFIDAGGGDVHMLRNNTGAPAETIAVQLLPQGAPRKTDAPEPTNCHV